MNKKEQEPCFKKKKGCVYLFLERGEGREKQKHGSFASHVCSDGGQTHTAGVCPNTESNWQPSPCGRTPNEPNHIGQGKNPAFVDTDHRLEREII